MVSDVVMFLMRWCRAGRLFGVPGRSGSAWLKKRRAAPAWWSSSARRSAHPPGTPASSAHQHRQAARAAAGTSASLPDQRPSPSPGMDRSHIPHRHTCADSGLPCTSRAETRSDV